MDSLTVEVQSENLIPSSVAWTLSLKEVSPPPPLCLPKGFRGLLVFVLLLQTL